MSTVAIYDDHVLARSGLAALLERTSIEVVGAAPIDLGHAAGGPAGAADVVLVAATERGTELARRLAGEHGHRVLLIMESPSGSAALVATLATGAAGTVCRQCAPERVIAVIEAVAADAPPPPCPHQHSSASGDGEPLLSLRERRVAAELARGHQTEEIAELLCISPHTVRTHVRNIRRKLGARTSAQAVALAITFQAVDPAGLSAARS